MVPTLAQWKTRTSSITEARRGNISNPEILTVDNHLALYNGNGSLAVSVVPLFDILATIEQWDKRRRGQRSHRSDPLQDRLRDQDSTRSMALERLWDEVTDELKSTIVFVFQNEFEVLGPMAPQRFLVTTGILSCIAVGLWHTQIDVAALGHLKQTNDAQSSINDMVNEFTRQLRSAGAHWAGNQVRVFLCGGRRGINEAKAVAIVNALQGHGIADQNIDASECLRAGTNSVQVAIDRQNKGQFVFTEAIKDRVWTLRSQGAFDVASSRQMNDQFFKYAY